MYACPFAQMARYGKMLLLREHVGIPKEPRTRGVLPSRISSPRESKFTRKIRRVASVNSQVAASFPRSKSAGSTKNTTLCTTVPFCKSPSGDSPFVNRHHENPLISNFYNI